MSLISNQTLVFVSIADSDKFFLKNNKDKSKNATPQYIYPLRGYLLQLMPIGCSAPPPPSHVSLVHFNTTHAVYTCRVTGHVFSDTLLPVMSLVCVGNIYDRSLCGCVR